MRAAVVAGLDKVDALGVAGGYAEVTGGLRGVGKDFAAFARGEVGYRPTANVSLFAFGDGTFRTSIAPAFMAGLGARVAW